MGSGRAEPHQGGVERWPADFEKDGNVRPARQPHGPAPKVIYLGIVYFWIFRGTYCIGGNEIQPENKPNGRRGLLTWKDKGKVSKDTPLSFGAVIADGVAASKTTPIVERADDTWMENEFKESFRDVAKPIRFPNEWSLSSGQRVSA